jgi:hypothetical protein
MEYGIAGLLSVWAVSGFKIAAELIFQALAQLFPNRRHGWDTQGALGVCQS